MKKFYVKMWCREVINSRGMSFNKIKPVYREMLMKLVMTMSKDEIFTRYTDSL